VPSRHKTYDKDETNKLNSEQVCKHSKSHM